MMILRKKCFITRQFVIKVLSFSSTCNNATKTSTTHIQTQEHKWIKYGVSSYKNNYTSESFLYIQGETSLRMRIIYKREFKQLSFLGLEYLFHGISGDTWAKISAKPTISKPFFGTNWKFRLELRKANYLNTTILMCFMTICIKILSGVKEADIWIHSLKHLSIRKSYRVSSKVRRLVF